MKTFYRYLILVFLIILACAFYLAGSATGAIASFIVGGVFELLFWIGLIKTAKKR